MRQYSAAARMRLTEPWEEYVGYPYDDKVPKRHIDGVFRYPEYTFEHPPVGTISIGFGHTDAAGNLKITKGMRLTREEAGELEGRDLAPVEAMVNRLLKVEVTQHQFDALVDTGFNCPKAAIAAIALTNDSRPEQVPAKLLQYTYSKGEHMDGLVHRRTAEIVWFNHPDDAPAPAPAAEPHPDLVFCPKGERNPPPKTILESRTAAAGFSIGGLSIAELASSFSGVLDQLKAAKGSLDELGFSDMAGFVAHDPKMLACVAVAGLAGFVIFDRHLRLVNDHV